MELGFMQFSGEEEQKVGTVDASKVTTMSNNLFHLKSNEQDNESGNFNAPPVDTEKYDEKPVNHSSDSFLTDEKKAQNRSESNLLVQKSASQLP
jgi:hypothetical protein